MFEKEIEEYERIRQEYQQKIAIGLLMSLLANTPQRIAVIVIAVIDALNFTYELGKDNSKTMTMTPMTPMTPAYFCHRFEKR